MKQPFTILLATACVLFAMPAFGDELQSVSIEADSVKNRLHAPADAGARLAGSQTDANTTLAGAETDDQKNTGDKKNDAADKKKDSADKNKSSTDKRDAADKDKHDSTTSTPSSAKTKPAPQGSFASRAVSFMAGTILGTPIAIVREIGGETKIATKDLVGETNNWLLIAPALPLGLIGGVLSGTPQGLMFGVKNAFEGSIDEPFSAEAFSLADELEE